MREYQEIPTPSGLPLHHLGPPLEEGPLPTLFYFALSGRESLTLAPYNQPIQFFEGKKVRAFSLTLPHHSDGVPPNESIAAWVREIGEGKDPIAPFLEKGEEAIRFALSQGWIDRNRLAFGGLSRGGFIAAHLAAHLPEAKWLLGYAPLTRFSFSDLPTPYDLTSLAPSLCHKRVRFYIGNADTRVSTQSCFETLLSFVKAAEKAKIRSAPLELILFPSIDSMGHGTPPHIFAAGAAWLESEWLS